MRFFHRDSDKDQKTRKFHPLRRQIAVLFIGLLLLSMIVITLINGVFLEHYYISRKTDVLREAVEKLEQLEVETDSDGNSSAKVPDEMFKNCSENNLTWVVVTVDGQTVCSVGSNEDLLEARLVGYIYDLDQKKGKEKILQRNDRYVIQQVSDRFAGMEYVESWGELESGYYFLIRTPLESIRESVAISNSFYFYVGLAIIALSGLVVWVITKRITKPISELTQLSTKMSELDFEAKYHSQAGNEIDELGENFNRMSEQLEKTISELKSANNQLLKDIENKEKIDQMRQEFLNNVSHELKTPIALVQGYAEGLKENISDDPESREFYCDVIMDEAAKMNKLVKNLLTLNQLESGRDEVVMERFDIVSLIRGVLQSMDIMIQQKAVKVSFEAPESVYVWADEFKIEEVVTNYTSNALNHVNGEKAIEIRVLPEDDHVRVTVFNTGTPIPEEDVPKLWNKFYKVDKARTREYGGSGIGLSIVKAIMEGLHQQYGVQNYDNGVEFWFTLDRKND
ncbi:MAG: HAMP domain-containing sensor histidine kinase [Eubacteriales bacterium]|nr:HAMP domain-containing sensor histidine kinase [Eubacteriales bacterium]